MLSVNLWAAWIGILLGMASGAVMGLRFDPEQWLGGYGSWPRRMIRLGHISFFGLAFVNLAFVFTVGFLADAARVQHPLPLHTASWLLVAGAALMPAVCFASAWDRRFRRLFFLPVGALLAGVVSLLAWGVMS